MLFKPEMCKQILAGDKTQTRRVVNPKERIFISDPKYHTVTTDGRVKWQVGCTYAIQPGRGKKAVGRIKLLSIRQERLQNISDDDCLAEGIFKHYGHYSWACLWVDIGQKYYSTPRYAFQALWDSINTKKDTRWADNPDVWCLEFVLVGWHGAEAR